MDIDFDLISGMIDEIINSEAEEWIGINAKELAENIKMTIKQIFSDNQHAPKDTAIDIYRKDIREKSVDPVTVAKVDRWRKRCEILALIKQNDQEGIPMPQKEIAKKLGVSVGAVNKIFQLYALNNNVTNNELWEKVRGRKPDPFKKIPAEMFFKLCSIFENFVPTEFGLPFYSWSAKAIYCYLSQKGYEIKISYIYDFCRKMGITSKFVTRKNPKEIWEESLYYESIKFPKICRETLHDDELLIHLDETHVEVSHHIRGYSLKNRPSMGAYDQGLSHSNISLITFIGILNCLFLVLTSPINHIFSLSVVSTSFS